MDHTHTDYDMNIIIIEMVPVKFFGTTGTSGSLISIEPQEPFCVTHTICNYYQWPKLNPTHAVCNDTTLTLLILHQSVGSMVAT